jgi:hypothetical protein
MRLIKRLVIRPLLLLLVVLVSACKPSSGDKNMYFTRNAAEQALEQAINDDDADGINAALAAGADVNTQGKAQVTPLMMAVAKFKKQAVSALLEAGADPNIRDAQNDNAVILAVQAYGKDPKLLEWLLEAGGNPNTQRGNDNPIITNFLSAFNKRGAQLLIDHGANVDVRNRSGDPIIMSYARTQAWDNVWFLIQNEAHVDYPNERSTWMKAFQRAHTVPPGSPIWPYKMKSWLYLKEQGELVPSDIMALIDEDYFADLDKQGAEYPTAEELMGEGYEAYFERHGLELKHLPEEMQWETPPNWEGQP